VPLYITGLFLHAAYILSDAGYDVWLGNARGNMYSRRHEYLTTHEKKFWNFR
jgi:lysosomal acid lipase/cholesteryl ester hydrolase